MTAVMLLSFCIALIVLILFAGAEMAIGSVSRDSLERLAENRVRGAALILKMTTNKRRFRLMLMSGKALALAGGTVFLYTFFSIQSISWGMTTALTGILTILASVAVYIAAEGVLAKLISTGEYEKRVSRFAYFLITFHVIFYPVTYLLDVILSILIKKNLEMAEKEEAFIELMKSETESGVIEQEEKEMIESIFEFSDTTVREVMVPRIDVVAVEKGITINELIALFKKEGHSRIPVYDERMDSILGVIYAKDLLAHISEKGKKSFSITDILRKAYFVPENKKISELLKEFKKAKVHIAIVVDEYGGTAGIVALEDLLEEIVGEIQDEYDEDDERDYVRINDTTLLMDAGLDIDDVNEIVRTDISDEKFDTLGGFIYHRLGFIPKGGEQVQWKNVMFTIKEINGNRISKVLVEIHSHDENSNHNEE